MRNIKIIQQRQKPGSLLPVGCHSAVYCLGDYGSLYYCGGGTLFKFSLEDDNNPRVLCESEDVLRDVCQIQYVGSTGILYLVNERSSFLQCHAHSNAVEELFQSEQGIAYFSVSPDSRCAAIVTKQNTLLLLTLPDLETLSQQNLNDKEDVSSAAGSVKIVWRQDSHYFAVNYKQDDRFQIKIFDETGAFHSKTEDINPLLDSVLEWQPSGGLLAGTGTTPHGTVVSLFERNGLKRADFYPYEGKGETYEENKVKTLSWNSSSDILGVVYENEVELWSRNNYVWMRKLTLARPVNDKSKNDNKLVFIAWDNERSNRLHVVDATGGYFVYDVAFTYTSGHADGSALVASWNGTSIFSTPFRTSCCPPPNCLFQSNCTTDVKAVLIPEFWSGLLTLSTNGEVTFRRCEQTALKEIKTANINDFQQFSESYGWQWPTRNKFCCISSGTLIVFDIENGDFEDTEKEIRIVPRILPSGNIVAVYQAVKCKEESAVVVQIQDGSILKLDLNTGERVLLCKFPQICTELQVLGETFVVGHDPLTRKLMVGWTKYPEYEALIINNDCTSFLTFQSSLLFITIQGSLEVRHCNYLLKLLEKHVLGIDFNEEEIQGRYTRKCEKGSQIVTCCLNQMLEPSLVLQVIPRGNLEIIYPRPLIIDTVKVIMREKENDTRYEKIMNALRRHRIDYRMLIDEMKVMVQEETDCRLEELLKTMVEQVKDSHSLVLLITDLNQDYSECILIVKNILEGVIKANTEKRLLHVEESYLASMAKLGLLEEALKSALIQGESETNRELVQHRVKFLSFYCENPDILFDTALGTYDLSLAALVADCLGKDPKEYIPILDGFQSMLELKRRFKIDDKLRKYNKAVISLIRDSRVMHEEIVKYMERHRLFTDVIEFLRRKLKYDEGGIVERSQEDTALLLRTTQCSYAAYLEERAKFIEAGILYRESGNLSKAVESCIKSGNWEFALEIEYESGSDEDKITSLSKKILVQLEEKKMFSDAARLCETYLDDIQQAIHFWIRDRKWQHASALCMKSRALGKTYREEHVKPKLLESFNEHKEVLQQIIEDVNNKLARLRIVRQTKAARLTETGGFGDNFSDTESYLSGSSTSGSISSSNISGKSYRSGKNKRKLDRKVYSLKEGSKYEDLAIVAYLWGVVEKIQQEVKPETSYAIESLWKFNLNECAVQLCEMLESLLPAVENCVQEVWSLPIADEVLETKYRIPPVTWVSGWNKLALHEPSSKAAVR